VDVDVEFQPTSRASINLTVNYVADYKDISRETSGIINGDDYVVLDLAAGYNINKQWRVFGRIENLTDAHYEPADGFQASDRGVFAGAELSL
jgi:vitamin B12 transporter